MRSTLARRLQPPPLCRCYLRINRRSRVNLLTTDYLMTQRMPVLECLFLLFLIFFLHFFIYQVIYVAEFLQKKKIPERSPFSRALNKGKRLFDSVISYEEIDEEPDAQSPMAVRCYEK